MILANLVLPKVEIPEKVLHYSKIPDVGVKSAREFGKDATWVACSRVQPHVDDMSWEGKLFLTLSFVSSHSFGDAKMVAELDHEVPPGTLFVVDPMVRHWLFARHESEEGAPFIGLQWEVKHSKAKKFANELVKRFSGKKISCVEPRYQTWIK